MKKIKRFIFYFSKLSLKELIFMIKVKFFKIKFEKFYIYERLLLNKKGLEIGGPSKMFEADSFLPIYNVIGDLDGVNFNSETLWEKNLSSGKTYKFSEFKKNGMQFLCDAVDLEIIKSNTYEFVLSCNNLEHIANPIKALKEWLRVLKYKGIIILILPNNSINFDHKRKITNLDHVIDDYNKKVCEDDMTHIKEILKLHDLNLDPGLKSFDYFENRCKNNFDNRGMHHHVYDLNLLNDIFQFLKIETIYKHSTVFDHFIIGRKNFR